jgi:hypothetical protein
MYPVSRGKLDSIIRTQLCATSTGYFEKAVRHDRIIYDEFVECNLSGIAINNLYYRFAAEQNYSESVSNRKIRLTDFRFQRKTISALTE